MNLNRVVITGNLTRDPELRQVGSNGTSVCDLGVAVNEREKVNGEWEDRASFFDVTVWGSQADACDRYLRKGKQVAIDGRLRQERWQTDAGDNRSRIKIVAQAVQFIGPKDDGEDRPVAAATTAVGDGGDDVPF